MENKELNKVDQTEQVESQEVEQEAQVLELTEDQIAQLLSQQALTLDTSNVEDIQIFDESFEDGVYDVSEVCGSISALVSVGLTPAEALDYICNKETMAYNLQLAELNNKTSIEIAKINAVQVEKAGI